LRRRGGVLGTIIPVRVGVRLTTQRAILAIILIVAVVIATIIVIVSVAVVAVVGHVVFVNEVIGRMRASEALTARTPICLRAGERCF
jgi:hypothetical protein